MNAFRSTYSYSHREKPLSLYTANLRSQSEEMLQYLSIIPVGVTWNIMQFITNRFIIINNN